MIDIQDQILPWEEGYAEQAATVNTSPGIECYQCHNPGVLGGSAYFPFCSSLCKEEYAAKHFLGAAKKHRTVEECQARIKEMVSERRQTQSAMQCLFD